ncbi:N-methylhydantoinase A/oxoprolinase/acetone carboxylase, beta subunit [Humidesulfovibrio mexicanus]|uniref:N-methylhydantoinase A/oxoprolinase/acetone carboxylase, beta subunit n=1 Tax=Humidesulfovibrio mexicanus TaxID=147047 RepID=A0A239CAJ6_9BACT|nr:hydantoinase/oxoprolinase family protein [Humidesulfovibrio mexicanus]SNS17110.1 N-methylhydantoinase A/oxoprolinase/acetone carboxylase, beta subunit [Humidesulfovibrio mexicanus]
MFLGIDVGGTHTDAVALDESGIAAQAKVRTDHADLLGSVNAALAVILKSVPPGDITQLNLSTTLSTNAIVQGNTEDVGMLVVAGTGINPGEFMLCRDYHALGGAIDHRGSEVERLDEDQARAAIAACRKAGVKVFGCVGKFSTRNPLHENSLRQLIGPLGEGGADAVTLGHELGGRLNFPRRLATAYFNCAVWRVFNQFADAVEQSLERLGLGHVRVNTLKADGGTFPLAQARKMPVQSIFSGPAASVMGIIALCDITHDSVILDIGGTTTDIAVFVDGQPLVEHDGIHIGSHPTLVRALKVRSIGIGGDSAIGVLGETVRVGPNRLGPSQADGVPPGQRPAADARPTLIDALNCTGACAHGNVEASRLAVAAFAARHSISPELLAAQAVEAACEAIYTATRELLDEINDKPVYTIHELLEGRRVAPRRVYVMGGPAQAMKEPLRQRFELFTVVPEHSGVANAIGAALTRNTASLELFADTEKGVMFIPALSHRENVPRNYSLQEASRDALNHLLAHLSEMGVFADRDNAQVNHASSFNMVSDGVTTGRNIRVKCQIKPGVAFVLNGQGEGGR